MEIEIILALTVLSFISLFWALYKRFFSLKQAIFQTPDIKQNSLIKYLNPFGIQIKQTNNELLIILSNQLKCYFGIYWNVNIHKFFKISHLPWAQVAKFQLFHQMILETCTDSQLISINEANINKQFKFDILSKHEDHQNTKCQSIYPAVIIMMLTDEDLDTENICFLITMVHISSNMQLPTSIISQLVRRPNSLPFYLKKMFIPQEVMKINKENSRSDIDECDNLQKSNIHISNTIDSKDIKENVAVSQTQVNIEPIKTEENDAQCTGLNSIYSKNRKIKSSSIISSAFDQNSINRIHEFNISENLRLNNYENISNPEPNTSTLKCRKNISSSVPINNLHSSDDNLNGNNFDKLQPNYISDKHKNSDALNDCTLMERINIPLCSVCLLQEVTCIILPCRHVCTCDKCTEKLTNCPLCRSYISYTLLIKLS